MKDERKKLKKINNRIEINSYPPSYHRAVRKLRKEEYDKSSKAHTKFWIANKISALLSK